VAAWITNDLPNTLSFADWQSLQPWSLPGDADAFADPDLDGSVNYLEWLTSTDPLLSTDFWSIGIQRATNEVQVLVPQIANRAIEVQYSDHLGNAPDWLPLDVVDNRPLFSSSNLLHSVTDPSSIEATRFYRVRIYEP